MIRCDLRTISMTDLQRRLLPTVMVSFIVCLLLISSIGRSQEGTFLARIPIIIRDRSGSVIPGITAQDLTAKIAGNSANVAAVAVDSRPHRMVILLDTSASMNGVRDSKEWKLPVDIATYTATAVSPNMGLALVAFDENAHDVVDFSQGNAAVLKQLNRMSAAQKLSEIGVRKRTALYDAVYRGWQLIDKPTSADMLLVISDGDDNKSSLKPEALEKTLIGSGVRFFAVRIQDFDDPSLARYLEASPGPRVLAEIAAKTGGEVFGPVGFRLGAVNFAFAPYDYSEKTNLKDAFGGFLQGIVQQEAAEIEFSSASTNEQPLEIKLSYVAAHRWKGAILSYQRKFVPIALSAKPASALR